ncbi:UDP-N-acetylmuramoyl-tripeptide--D-alanyl-D-alanine ligase [Serinibacter salmoneus]|uniref:UDP-N-acetylmuramoyl-tripeptide--D-alanyl-D-alanine ligase n=2 Tax=Serinibacter salmoneus TaxID=556530 RepID=A0A2A9CYB3_9MICO|nr:UDP-N-acetylmuramoyl-tripeptide--D-alanyl-D-alanine ligase [Serinibacter salmoneus]
MEQVAQATGGRLVGEGGAEVTAVAIDSRAVRAGDLYVALPGARVDGHAFVDAARAAGATGSLTTRDLGEQAGPHVVVEDAQTALGDLARADLLRRQAQGGTPDVVAITGSVGKTTTKDLVQDVLGALGHVYATRGSLNNEIGLPRTVLDSPQDTRVLVAEMGADAPGNLTYLTSIAPPRVAVVLAVGRAHLEGFGSIEGVQRAKAELVQALRPGGLAVLNHDDARVLAMRADAELVGAGVVTYSASGRPEAQVRAENTRVLDTGQASFDLCTPQGRASVTLALIGGHHVANALAAAAVALELGMSVQQVAEALAVAGPRSPHRMARHDLAGGVTLIDDSYNANPESMRAALRALVALARGRRSVAVLGEMRELGESSRDEHDALGRLAVRLDVDKLLVVGQGARPLYTGALLEGSFGEEAHFVTDPDQAEAWLRDTLEPGDVVLLKASNGAGLHALADRLVGGGA